MRSPLEHTDVTLQPGDLLERIAGDEGQLVLRFFATFSRFECALKRSGFVKADRYDNALADWDRLAAEVLDGQLAKGLSPAFTQSKAYLVEKPPRKQIVSKADHSMAWHDNSQRAKESDGQYLLRLIRDVRNNLFHGGKYPTASGGPVDGAALRNAALLRASMTVLDECLSLNDRVRTFFQEAD